jgi:hypothetical protein
MAEVQVLSKGGTAAVAAALQGQLIHLKVANEAEACGIYLCNKDK